MTYVLGIPRFTNVKAKSCLSRARESTPSWMFGHVSKMIILFEVALPALASECHIVYIGTKARFRLQHFSSPCLCEAGSVAAGIA